MVPSESNTESDDRWVRPPALLAAWQRLLLNHRSKEFQQGDIEEIARNPEAHCAMLSQALRAGRYRPQSMTAFHIPKRSGGTRTLLVPAASDRIVQGALAQWLQGQTEPWLLDASHAYRPERGVLTAAAQVRQALGEGRTWAWRADIAAFFDEVDHGLLIDTLKRHGLWHNRLADVLKRALRVAVAPERAGSEGAHCLVRGLPQGAPLSPVLSNVYLHAFDSAMALQPARLVRFADDFVLLAHTAMELQVSIRCARQALGALQLRVNEDKSLELPPGEAFQFLGERFDSATHSTGPVNRVAFAGSSDGAVAGEHVPDDDEPAADAMASEASPPASAITQPDFTEPAELATPLLRTLYLLDDFSELARDGDALVVRHPGKPPLRVPSARLSQVLAFGATNLTSGAIALCLERDIPVMLLSGRGKHFGVIDPLRPPNLTLLKAQIEIAEDPARALRMAQSLVSAKLGNSLVVLRRWRRRQATQAIDQALQRLADARRRIHRMVDLNALRGLEGSAAAAYFQALRSLLPDEWRFEGRRRQPPPDPVNSMLSYGYTLLYYNTLTLTVGRGLQPHLGMLHAPRAGHHALVSDLIEPFRSLAVDTTVADLALNGGVRPDQFNWPEDPKQPCLMSPQARRKLIDGFETRMNSRREYPELGMRLDMRRLIDLQALQLAEALQGRLAEFTAFTTR